MLLGLFLVGCATQDWPKLELPDPSKIELGLSKGSSAEKRITLISNQENTRFRFKKIGEVEWKDVGVGKIIATMVPSSGNFEISAKPPEYREMVHTISEPISEVRFTFMISDKTNDTQSDGGATRGTPVLADVEHLKAGVVKVMAQIKGHTKIGSGFIVRLEKDATYIVTASHVIEGDPHPQIIFFGHPGQPHKAAVVRSEGGDARGVAALIVNDRLPSGLRALKLESLLRVKDGEMVTLIGFPRVAGTDWAITPGTVAGRRGTDLTVSGTADEGSSGGPIIKDNGNVIAFVTEVLERFVYARPVAGPVFDALKGWGVLP
jgi:S1-C subfamily serine protease